METENADRGAHCICERIAPFMSKRLRRGSAPTAKICVYFFLVSSITLLMGENGSQISEGNWKNISRRKV